MVYNLLVLALIILFRIIQNQKNITQIYKSPNYT